MKNINIGFIRGFFLATALLLSGCASGPNFSKLAHLPTDATPQAPVAAKLRAYRVQIGDVLDINFYLNPEFDETVTVRPDGMISTKVVEELSVYNRTIPDINKSLKKLYKKDLKDPYVNTVVRSFAPIRIYVSGEVNAPGEYVVVGQALTLTQAIARAGGIKNSGVQDKVLVIRRGASEKPEAFVADYYGATQAGDVSKDARLAADDVVFVPRSGIALTYAGYQQYIQQFVSPTTGINGGYSIK
jgi:polysaccharide export outer membrane protein